MTEKKGNGRQVLGIVLATLTYFSVLVYFEADPVVATGLGGVLWWAYISMVVLALYAMIADQRLPFNGLAVLIEIVTLIYVTLTPETARGLEPVMVVPGIFVVIVLPLIFAVDWLFQQPSKPKDEPKAATEAE